MAVIRRILIDDEERLFVGQRMRCRGSVEELIAKQAIMEEPHG